MQIPARSQTTLADQPETIAGSMPRSVQRVRQRLTEIMGGETLELNEGLGRIRVTTSTELYRKGVGHFQISSNALQSLAPVGKLQEMLTEQRAEMSQAMRQTMGTPAIYLRVGPQGSSWMMVPSAPDESGKWVVSTFDTKGFTGQQCFSSQQSAATEAFLRGYQVRDDAALDRVVGSPAFQKGFFASNLARRIERGEITAHEANRLLAEYDTRANYLARIASRGAQAFVVPAGDVMYLLADRIAPGTEQAVFLHETVHRYGRRVLGVRGFDDLVGQVKRWSDRPANSVEFTIYNKANERAAGAAPLNSPLYDEELFAYAVEEAVQRGVKPSALAHPESAAGWLDQVSSTLRGVIQSITGPGPRVAPKSAQELVDLAYALVQIESPQRVNRILGALKPAERKVLNNWIGRGGAPLWFSQLQQRVRLLGQERMPPGQWISWIQAQTRSGIKPDEIEWSGVLEWLQTQPAEASVNKRHVVNFLERNGVQVQEQVYHSGEGAEYEQYKLGLGGGNYREVLLMLPNALLDQYEQIKLEVDRLRIEILEREDQVISSDAENDTDWLREEIQDLRKHLASTRQEQLRIERLEEQQFHSGHWKEANVLAHVRLTDRTDLDGKRVLFVEEIQSDWAQAGREKQFHTLTSTDGWSAALQTEADSGFSVWKVRDKYGQTVATLPFGDAGNEQGAILRAAKGGASKESVPAGPFVTRTDAWVALAIKRVLRIAAEEGYDKIAIINGDLMVNRNTEAEERTKGGMRVFYDEILPNVLKNVLRRLDVNSSADEDLAMVDHSEGWHLTPPENTVRGQWMLKSSDYTSSGIFFESEAQAQAALKDKLAESAHRVRGMSVTPRMSEQLVQPMALFSELPPNSPDLEYELVKARYQGTDQWLKAPNGKHTVLTERQWVQVRTPSFKAWFGDWEDPAAEFSRAVDVNGEPKVYYHGSRKAGFTEFETDGRDKTKDTGAFFTDVFTMATTYSGSGEDAPVYTAEQLLAEPDLLDGLEIERGILVEVCKEGRQSWMFFEDEESALEDLVLEEGEQLVTKPGFRVHFNGYEECEGSKEDALACIANLRAEAQGVYSVFLNVRNLFEYDWDNKSWDEGPTETVWNMHGGFGEYQDTVYSEEERDSYITKYPGSYAEEVQQAQFHTTDDAARDARMMGEDGLLMRDVWDSGPFGSGGECGDVMVVFDPKNIKSADVNCGAFDPMSCDIRESCPEQALVRLRRVFPRTNPASLQRLQVRCRA